MLSICGTVIHQIFSLARDWSKRVTWANIPQLKLGNIHDYNPPINFRAIALATLRHVLDSYHAITPV